jgi:hypothetical protein
MVVYNHPSAGPECPSGGLPSAGSYARNLLENPLHARQRLDILVCIVGWRMWRISLVPPQADDADPTHQLIYNSIPATIRLACMGISAPPPNALPGQQPPVFMSSASHIQFLPL